MLDERKAAILRAVVQEYITTAQPVGSAHIPRAHGVQVSSATIRNDMAMLEHDGYLVQPHTSAGRVPTDKGYRFFVDHLGRDGRLDSVATEQVGDFFSRAHGRIEELLSQTSDLLARLTTYASVVVGPKPEASVVRSVQIVGLSARMAMVVAVLSNGAVENRSIEFADEVSDQRLASSTAHLAHALVGRPFGIVESIIGTGDRVVDEVCTQALDALRQLRGDNQVFVGGAASVAGAFDAVDVVRTVLGTLEQHYVMVTLVRDVLDRGLSVSIGAEHGLEPLATCSVVVKSVVVDGEQTRHGRRARANSNELPTSPGDRRCRQRATGPTFGRGLTSNG